MEVVRRFIQKRFEYVNAPPRALDGSEYVTRWLRNVLGE